MPKVPVDICCINDTGYKIKMITLAIRNGPGNIAHVKCRTCNSIKPYDELEWLYCHHDMHNPLSVRNPLDISSAEQSTQIISESVSRGINTDINSAEQSGRDIKRNSQITVEQSQRMIDVPFVIKKELLDIICSDKIVDDKDYEICPNGIELADSKEVVHLSDTTSYPVKNLTDIPDIEISFIPHKMYKYGRLRVKTIV